MHIIALTASAVIRVGGFVTPGFATPGFAVSTGVEQVPMYSASVRVYVLSASEN